MSKESRVKSAIKSVSYIVTHELIFFFIAWGWSGNPATAAGIAVTGSLLELGYYYAHERLWNMLEIRKSKASK
jgi:uncharacterized membrane protein